MQVKSNSAEQNELQTRRPSHGNRLELIPHHWFSSRHFLFFCLIVVSSLFYCSWLAAVFTQAWNRDEYTHILLVIPISVCLIIFERTKLVAKPRFSVSLGVAGLFLSALITAAADFWISPHSGYRLTLNIFALVICWLSAVVLIYGPALFRALLFPLLFLFLVVPLPPSVLSAVIAGLQAGSAAATTALFRLSGIPVFHVGSNLAIPGLQIEIAEECSGIRSSIGLLVSCLLLAHFFLRSLWSKTTFVALVIPFSLAKNAVRIFTLSMLGLHVDSGFLTGRLHHDGGAVFFLLAFAALWGILRLLRFAEKKLHPVSSPGSA